MDRLGSRARLASCPGAAMLSISFSNNSTSFLRLSALSINFVSNLLHSSSCLLLIRASSSLCFCCSVASSSF